MIRKELLSAPPEELEKVAGTITEIERYAIHDGPGIRSVVFFKGCPLRCAWCCNPETQRNSPELGYFADKCIGCGRCVAACPHGAIRQGQGGLVTDRSICEACCYGKFSPFPCTVRCYSSARRMLGERITVLDACREVARDQDFYQESGGGITISGGEPMRQPEFAFALLKYCKGRWMDTAMETCGNASAEDYTAVAPYLDTVYIDLKNMDTAACRKWTGSGNEVTLGNIRHLSALALEVRFRLYVRVPVIPGFNDSAENIAATGAFIKKECAGVCGMELLPYHKLGRGKYKSLEREYPLQRLEPPSQERMDQLNKILLEMNIPVYQF